MITKLCAKCGEVIPYPLRYCERCQKTADRQKDEGKRAASARYNSRRDKELAAFYRSKEWKALSLKKLQQERYKCEDCGELAVEVHHKIGIKQDWSKRFDYDNLMALCIKCHNRREGRFIKLEDPGVDEKV